MKRKQAFKVLVFLYAILSGCGSDVKHNTDSENRTVKSESDSLHSNKILLKETFNQEDTVVNEYLSKQLKPIGENFKRINSITKWTTIEKKDLWETTEGGQANYYYSNGVLEKVVVRQFGETFQSVSEYYLLNGQLSFLLEKLYKYNRPFDYDSAKMKENNDDQSFNFEKSEIIEDRSYFQDGKLIHQIGQDWDAPFSIDYLLKEQNRIVGYFETLVK